MENKTYVLYHANCADGFGAAWVASLVLGAQATYLPVSYGPPPPALEEGSDVYILDFSYPRPELRAITDRARSVLVIDHHADKRAVLQDAAAEIANLKVVFDTSRSGAALTWREFMPEDPMPELVRYIEDRDLWKWELPESREVSAALASYPFDLAGWTELAKDMPRLKAEGKVALRMIDQQARRTAELATPMPIGGVWVPAVNATAFVSEVCHTMLELNPTAPFVASYRDEAAVRRWSLRARPGFDCSAIARLYPGGGGHPQASGFEEALAGRSLNGQGLIAAERSTHVLLGFDANHDAQHTNGSLIAAAICYAEVAGDLTRHKMPSVPAGWQHPNWPWKPEEWHPRDDAPGNLAKAGALLAAEIDRLDRSNGKGGVA